MRGDGERVQGLDGGIVVDDGGRPVTDAGGRPVFHGATPGTYQLDDTGTPPIEPLSAAPYDADQAPQG